MAEIPANIMGIVGSTPLVRLNRMAKGLRVNSAAKLEFRIPLGSVKDRIGVCHDRGGRGAGADSGAIP